MYSRTSTSVCTLGPILVYVETILELYSMASPVCLPLIPFRAPVNPEPSIVDCAINVSLILTTTASGSITAWVGETTGECLSAECVPYNENHF